MFTARIQDPCGKEETYQLSSSSSAFIWHPREGCTDLPKGEFPTMNSPDCGAPWKTTQTRHLNTLQTVSHCLMVPQPYLKACFDTPEDLKGSFLNKG